MSLLLLNEACLMLLIAGEFLCVALQVVHLALAFFRQDCKNKQIICTAEAAALLHLALALFLTVGTGLICAPVLTWTLRASAAFGALWANTLLAAAALAAFICTRKPNWLASVLFMALCTPAAISMLGAYWNIVAFCDISWFLFCALAGICSDLTRRFEKPSDLSIAEALMGMPIGILIIGPCGGSTFMNVQMRATLRALGLACDLGDQSELWTKLSELGRRLATEAAQLGVPDAIGKSSELMLVDLPDRTTWLFALDTGCGKEESSKVMCMDVTDATRANAELSQTNAELEAAASELRACMDDVVCAAETAAYLRMRSRVHDVIGQRLSILHRYLETDKTDASSVAELEELLSCAMADLRSKPDADATAELRAVVDAFALVKVKVEVEGALPDGEVGRTFVRIIRECCTNSCRHAHASCVSVKLESSDSMASLTVTDDGAMPCADYVEGGGIGGMRREMSHLGGTLQIRCEQGFAVHAKVDLKGACR